MMKNRITSCILSLMCASYAGFLEASTVTLYTPNGSSVYAFTRSETYNTPSKRNAVRVTYANQYPDAVVIGDPSTTIIAIVTPGIWLKEGLRSG